jgi:hypothetical protein
VVEEGFHRPPESADIEEHDRLGVRRELMPGQQLERFLGVPAQAPMNPSALESRALRWCTS